MIQKLTFSKRIRSSAGTLVVSIPPEIIEDMDLTDREMVEVRLTKKPHVQTTMIKLDGGVYVPTDMGVAEVFR